MVKEPNQSCNAEALCSWAPEERACRVWQAMKLAAALLYGIKTDTNTLEDGAAGADVRQFRNLLQ